MVAQARRPSGERLGVFRLVLGAGGVGGGLAGLGLTVVVEEGKVS